MISFGWVALVAGMAGADAGSEFLKLTESTVRSLQLTSEAQPAIALDVSQTPAPADIRETRTQTMEYSAGPPMKLETGRTPTALQ